jgi:hypothetical protein
MVIRKSVALTWNSTDSAPTNRVAYAPIAPITQLAKIATIVKPNTIAMTCQYKAKTLVKVDSLIWAGHNLHKHVSFDNNLFRVLQNESEWNKSQFYLQFK